MLYRAPVIQLKNGTISRRHAYIVVVMLHYPRFLTKALVDEYLRSLAPDKTLFSEFKNLERSAKDHELAFDSVRYEERFIVDPTGAEHLARLCELSRQRDVILICQCQPLERCHADLILLLAKHWFQASTQRIRPRYPKFCERIQKGELPLD